jgi:sarcosine oxidase, subunit beta
VNYDVAIIGGGASGMSIAANLLQLDRRVRVCVLDRGVGAGSGSTGRATGGFRAQFGSMINVRLSLHSRAVLDSFEDRFGVDPHFRRTGYLFAAESAASLAALSEAISIQQSAGSFDAHCIDSSEIRKLQPELRAERFAGGAFSPEDGTIVPLAMLAGYGHAFENAGGTIRFDANVVRARMRGTRIDSVDLAGGSQVAADTWVNAAGAWGGPVGEMLGDPIPIVPMKRQVAASEPVTILPETSPMTIVVDDGWHVRARDGRLLFLRPSIPASTDPYATDVEDSWIESTRERTREVTVRLGAVAIDRAASWAGLYEMTPDRHVLLGPSAKVQNLFVAAGSSGHGVMHSPAIGELVARMILGLGTPYDVRELAPDRFEHGAAIESIDLL